MEKDNKKITINDDQGNDCELEVIEEFEYKGKKYIMLYEEGECECESCESSDNECNESIYIYEVVEEKGKDKYIEITDEKLMNELIGEAEKILYKED